MHLRSLTLALLSLVLAAKAAEGDYCCPPESLDQEPQTLVDSEVQGFFLVCSYSVDTVCIYDLGDGTAAEASEVCPSNAETVCPLPGGSK